MARRFRTWREQARESEPTNTSLRDIPSLPAWENALPTGLLDTQSPSAGNKAGQGLDCRSHNSPHISPCIAYRADGIGSREIHSSARSSLRLECSQARQTSVTIALVKLRHRCLTHIRQGEPIVENAYSYGNSLRQE